MKIRTRADNRQLAEGERQIEDLAGAVSVTQPGSHLGVTGVMICTVRGIPSRKAQFAILSREGVDELISELQRVRDEVFG